MEVVFWTGLCSGTHVCAAMFVCSLLDLMNKSYEETGALLASKAKRKVIQTQYFVPRGCAAICPVELREVHMSIFPLPGAMARMWCMFPRGAL